MFRFCGNCDPKHKSRNFDEYAGLNLLGTNVGFILLFLNLNVLRRLINAICILFFFLKIGFEAIVNDNIIGKLFNFNSFIFHLFHFQLNKRTSWRTI